MILTVDIGNSRIKLAQWQSGIIVARTASAYDAEIFPDVLRTLLLDIEKPSKIFVVCVAGKAIIEALHDWVTRHWQLPVEVMKTEKRYQEIINAYADIEQHGVDRWACVVAAHELFPAAPVCVVGAGTAITFDLVSADGKHLGGYILPSYISMHQALLGSTAKVTSIMSEQFVDNKKTPDNTNDAVNAGLHKMLQAGVREICSTAKSVLGESMKIMVTGGSAPTLLAYPQMPEMHHQPDLVMQGLYKVMTQPDSAVPKKAEV